MSLIQYFVPTFYRRFRSLVTRASRSLKLYCLLICTRSNNKIRLRAGSCLQPNFRTGSGFKSRKNFVYFTKVAKTHQPKLRLERSNSSSVFGYRKKKLIRIPLVLSSCSYCKADKTLFEK